MYSFVAAITVRIVAWAWKAAAMASPLRVGIHTPSSFSSALFSFSSSPLFPSSTPSSLTSFSPCSPSSAFSVFSSPSRPLFSSPPPLSSRFAAPSAPSPSSPLASGVTVTTVRTRIECACCHEHGTKMSVSVEASPVGNEAAVAAPPSVPPVSASASTDWCSGSSVVQLRVVKIAIVGSAASPPIILPTLTPPRPSGWAIPSPVARLCVSGCGEVPNCE
mmetsp:Transcript_22147/g.56555  ORF Transcript_22147/g.56555 Transcript_22147/m.56555 type:complete len:219 (+) Transcript_22147:342-998(+)